MFSGKTIVVAGASAGIGRSICDELLSRNANLILIARESHGLELAKAELMQRNQNQTVLTAAIDLSENDSADKVSDFLKTVGEVDGVVANVGSGKPTSGDFSMRLRGALDKNLFSAVNTVLGSLPFLRPQEESSVVIVSSIAAHEVIRCPPEYAASKAALEMLAKHWASNYAPVRFNSVAPGNVLTDTSVWKERRTSDPEGLNRELSLNVPLSRLGAPEEVAKAVCFLLSRESFFITGACLAIDGGQRRSLR